MKKNTLIPLVFFLLFWISFFVFQNPAIYLNTLGKISFTYHVKEDGTKEEVKQPFTSFTNETAVQWDAEHYQFIKNYGYDITKAGGDYIYAYFPLFPYVWRLTGLSAVGAVFLNFLLFAIAISLLAKLFAARFNTILIICTIPVLVAFWLPHTEATFLLMISIGVYGYFKNKYWLYFLGIALGALTRNTFNLLLPAIVCTEVLFFLREKQFRQSLRRVFWGILPVIVGTGIFITIQYIQGSGNIFKFLEVQEQWNNSLSWPELLNLRDFSHESFSINVPTLLMVGIPITLCLFCIFLKQCNVLKIKTKILDFNSSDKKDYALVVAFLCCLASVFAVLFYRHGCLVSLSRFVLCSPYYMVVLFLGFEKIKEIGLSKRVFFFGVSFILSFLVFWLEPYIGRPIAFRHLGFLLFGAHLALFLFQDLAGWRFYKILLFSSLGLNIIWTSYLFNVYLCDGWIFT